MCEKCAELGLYDLDRKSQELQKLNARIMGMQLMGVFFGYPTCCIQWFAERATRIHTAMIEGRDFQKEAELPENQNNYTCGFIPCPECAKKVTPGTEGTLILSTRVCSTKYPFDHTSDKEFDKFMEGALK